MNLRSFLRMSAWCVVVLAFCALIAEAQSPHPNAEQSPDHGDTETADTATSLIQLEQLQGAIAELNDASEGEWKLQLDEYSGLPRTMRGALSRPYAGKPDAIAAQFLTDNAELFGLHDESMSLQHERSIEHKLGHRVTMAPRYKNLPIAHGKLILLVNSNGQVMYVASTAWPVSDINVQPGVTSAAARRSVERQYAPDMATDVGGTWQKPQLAIYPKERGRLAWLVHRRLGELDDLTWEFAIDANTGELLEYRNVIPDAGAHAHHAHADPPRKRPSNTVTKDQFHAARNARALAGGAPDPCDRTWFTVGDATVTERTPAPTDQFHVDVALAPSNFGSLEEDLQPENVNGAGIQLLPCIEYTITIDWDLATWDSYNTANGHWDVIVAHINSVGFYWDIVFPPGISEQNCDTAYDRDGLIDLPGPLWTSGGADWGDGFLCTSTGSFSFTYEETDPSNSVFLSIALDTFVTGDVDGLYPSWGTINVLIEGETKAFDPNPVTALNNGGLTDMGDANAAVPCNAYIDVDPLPHLATPAAGQPYTLTGDYCKIVDKPTELAYMPPTSRDGVFPYIRDCDHFEAVNCYYAITVNQDYIQALGFNTINNRQIEVDPHAISADNSFYTGNATGTGFLIFGDGGVDDGEDADVIIHEYGHSIQDNSNIGAFFGTNNNGWGNETGALGEAFGDYWACSTYFPQNTSSGFNPALFANWDAVPGGLRNLGNNKTYPASMGGSIHANGEIWSGALWDLSQVIGLVNTDILALEANFWVPAQPDFVDNADAVLLADFIHNGSANEDAIVDAMLNRGIYRRVRVESSPDAAPITVSAMDKKDDQNGTATFDRFYGHGDSVTLTAPANHGGEAFRRWKLDGVPQALGVDTLNVTFNEVPNTQHTAKAIFGALPGDTNGDDVVNIVDFLAILSNWGACPAPCPPSCSTDVNGDCVVNILDFLMVLGEWG